MTKPLFQVTQPLGGYPTASYVAADSREEVEQWVKDEGIVPYAITQIGEVEILPSREQ